MAFLRAYDALPVDTTKLSPTTLLLLAKLQQDSVEEWEKALPDAMYSTSNTLPPEDISFINQAVEWLKTLNPDILCEVVDEL